MSLQVQENSVRDTLARLRARFQREGAELRNALGSIPQDALAKDLRDDLMEISRAWDEPGTVNHMAFRV